MKRHVIDIFSELGRWLAALPPSVTGHAVAANPWFTPDEVRRAAENIAADMLSPDVLSAWLSRYPALPVAQPCDILIIMAGNIPFVGLHDLLCVLAAGHRAIVKPSSKDAVLMSRVVGQLLDMAPDIPVTLFSDAAASSFNLNAPTPLPDAVIATGGDDAVLVFREKYAGIPMLLRGNRSSLAVLDGMETPAELAALADDVLLYSGLGCRNVSLVFVPHGYDFTGLQNAMAERETTLNPKYRNNYRQARALLTMNSRPHIDCRSCLLVEKRDFPSNISILNYSFYYTLSEIKVWVTGHADEIQCVVEKSGTSQRPALTDYSDGCDVMEFLLSLQPEH